MTNDDESFVLDMESLEVDNWLWLLNEPLMNKIMVNQIAIQENGCTFPVQ